MSSFIGRTAETPTHAQPHFVLTTAIHNYNIDDEIHSNIAQCIVLRAFASMILHETAFRSRPF